MKVFIEPIYRGEDKGDGGIRRVVEAQRRYLHEYNVDVVDTLSNADLAAVHAGSTVRADLPVVNHCHGLYWAEYEWPKWALSLNKDVIESMRRADIVTAPSKWVARALSMGMLLDPVVLYHGIEPNDWNVGSNEGYVLWNKTRVDPICDPTPIVELAKRVPNMQFISTYSKPLPNIKITGRLPFTEAKQLIQNAGVYLATSRETFGIGTLEAMISGVPILGYEWGGQAEFIEHKVNGYLVRPGDIENLIQGLAFCISHRNELGANARQLVLANFTWRDVIKGYADVYERALRAKPEVKVSVVMPCYNLAKYLPDAVQSVLRQTYKNFEIIIVNDCSPDNTQEVAQALAEQDSRIRIIRNETNQYLSEALNIGIRAARGEYILPLDADNEITEHSLEILVGVLDRDPSLDIVYGAMEVVEDDGSHFISGWPSGFDYEAQLNHRNQCTSTSLYRKRVWQRVGGYRRRCRTAEDADFWCRATTYGGRAAKVTDAVILIYHNRKESMSHVERDWGWSDWYPWGKDKTLTPFGAPVSEIRVPSYEPTLISVIIPVGPGHERYLIDALDSLVGQTFRQWEAIVVNDSGEEFGWIHPFAQVIDTGGKRGPAYARNIGAQAAKAPLILFLDADDYFQPNALQYLYDTWKQTKGYVYSDWVVQETRKIQTAEEYTCDGILRSLPHAVTALMTKQMWQEAGGFDETIEAWEDWDFFIALNAAGYCGVRVPEPLLQYRASTGSRREEMYAKRDELKQIIKNKWIQYYEGGQKLMPCGGCRKGGGKRINTPPTAVNAAMTTSSGTDNAVLIEYVGKNATVNYIGKASGTRYRFGSDPGHKIKYVWRADAEQLLTFKEFRVAKAAEPILEASGPPDRT